jgi:hypothetical protein
MLVHIINLMAQKILDSIGSSNHENAADLLDPVAASKARQYLRHS